MILAKLIRLALGTRRRSSDCALVLIAWSMCFVVPHANAADPAPAAPPGLQAGAAMVDITPQIGSPIVGGFSPAPSTHIHDDLHARCLVLDDGKRRVALIVCDLLGMHRTLSDEARRLIQEQSGISKENILISATHTHSASSALGDRAKIVQKPDDYQLFVARRIADGVTRTVNTLRPAELAYGTVEAPEHVFNRRWFMRPGTMPENPFGTSELVKMNPPGGSPNLVEPAGTTDPTVHFLAVREPDGKPIGLFAAYSLHYVGDVGPGHVSSDYFGMFCERMKTLLTPERQDPPFVAALANGTSGDVNNNNFRNPRPSKPRYKQMEFVAYDVAAKVHAAMEKLTYRRDITVDARYREPMIGSRILSAEQIEWAKQKVAEPVKEPTPKAKVDLSRIYAERMLRLADAPAELPMPLQVLRVGDVCIGTTPCETFVETGLEFKSRSPLKQAFMVSLNHGYYGYLPTPRQHELGGYETWPGTNRLEKQASVKFLDNLIEMAGELAAPPATSAAKEANGTTAKNAKTP
ncbi:MAG: neutral/alkaline non-lysosomal ceramidase N-terminal domain-containing protein [Planctomycetia bacterium]|nr:neutral/alkaline non-lysosomal ceramidase N-terminal domain-containing protein [Planctomycetia bacterium]